MAKQHKATAETSVSLSHGGADKRPNKIDLAVTREVLEQIDMAQRLMQNAQLAHAVQLRLSATIARLSEHLWEPEEASWREVFALESKQLSGPDWVNKFPGSNKLTDCIPVFKSALEKFLKALADAGAKVDISSTLRPPERAYLMHWSWKIANDLVAPENVPAFAGVEIEWVHRDPAGLPDIPKCRTAAKQMVSGYGIVAQPALVSRHTQGRAVDMTISWTGALSIMNSDKTTVKIATTPKNGMNSELHKCAATYRVIKASFDNDPPHWSDDGY